MSKVNLKVVVMASGVTYLGELGDRGIGNALEFSGNANESCFRQYVTQKNLGELQDVSFSAVTDYTSRCLDAEEEALFVYVSGMFVMAQKRAKAFNENACFESLYGKK